MENRALGRGLGGIVEKLNDVLTAIGYNIIRLRIGGGMSQDQLAEKSGIGRSTIQRMERGEPCTLDNLIRVAEVLGVNTADLFLTNADRAEITYKTKLLCDKLGTILNLK
jgi:transcriptional regulator with XRE-family HTH domain